MNSTLTLVTTLTVGSSEVFQLRVFKDGLLWDLTGATVLLKFVRPDGSTFSLTPFTTYLGGAKVNWSVTNNPGAWLRAWDITDAGGIRQVSTPISFNVISSPS